MALRAGKPRGRRLQCIWHIVGVRGFGIHDYIVEVIKHPSSVPFLHFSLFLLLSLYFFSSFFFLIIFHDLVYVWRSGDNLQELVFSSYYVHPGYKGLTASGFMHRAMSLTLSSSSYRMPTPGVPSSQLHLTLVTPQRHYLHTPSAHDLGTCLKFHHRNMKNVVKP